MPHDQATTGLTLQPVVAMVPASWTLQPVMGATAVVVVVVVLATVVAKGQGRTVDDIRDELAQGAGRPLAVFDPRRALALMKTLVAQARREGHPKLEEFLVFLETTSPHAGEYYFRGLLIDRFGSGVVKKVSTGIDAYVKLQNKLSRYVASLSSSGHLDGFDREKEDGLGHKEGRELRHGPHTRQQCSPRRAARQQFSQRRTVMGAMVVAWHAEVVVAATVVAKEAVVMEDLRREVLGMRETLGRLQHGRTVEDIRDELAQ
ncbi:Hypp2228 [Branchiostoma lanceolatum]|uniref:Hypp2228 protein n=1 Tax=Branchiostoma lanceolatum TaxID=7740 RepID=A0A8J9ZSC5_BRALA|nr:Hypp2228 [Branchiostoma lanceolatum]